MNHKAARRRFLIALGALGCAAPARASDDELTQLFAGLGARRERHARFVERKFSALLKAPIESSGTLVFRAPDILERRTIEPQREWVRIQGNVVTYEGAARGKIQQRTLALSDAPLLAALVESLRATLAGNLPELRRHYEVSKTGTGQAWGLTLVPRERALRDAVERIQLRGTGSEVNEVEIVEAGGDLTLLRIFPSPAPAK